MSEQNFIVEREGAVTTIRFNSPGTMNAMTMPMAAELRERLREAEKTTRAVILAGTERAFCSGANLSGNADEGGIGDADAGLALEDHINPLMMQMHDLAIPLVTAVRGAAAGVGASLALIGDIIVAGRSAYFLQAFGRIGLIPDGGSPWLLVKSVGRVRAMELMLLAEKLPAETAFAWGMVTRLVDDAQVEATAMALATRLAAGPTTALALTRKAAWAAASSGYEEELRFERHAQRTAGRHPDFAEGVAAFREKRPARFGQTGV